MSPFRGDRQVNKCQVVNTKFLHIILLGSISLNSSRSDSQEVPRFLDQNPLTIKKPSPLSLEAVLKSLASVGEIEALNLSISPQKKDQESLQDLG